MLINYLHWLIALSNGCSLLISTFRTKKSSQVRISLVNSATSALIRLIYMRLSRVAYWWLAVTPPMWLLDLLWGTASVKSIPRLEISTLLLLAVTTHIWTVISHNCAPVVEDIFPSCSNCRFVLDISKYIDMPSMSQWQVHWWCLLDLEVPMMNHQQSSSLPMIRHWPSISIISSKYNQPSLTIIDHHHFSWIKTNHDQAATNHYQRWLMVIISYNHQLIIMNRSIIAIIIDLIIMNSQIIHRD